MNDNDVVFNLTQKFPPEPIFEISTQDIIIAIVKRLGESSLDLTSEDLELAREEVLAAIEHHLDEREYIEIGLDAWEAVRNL